MRLINVQDPQNLKFKEFFDSEIPPYVILSHRWGSTEDEVSYSDFIHGRKKCSPGYDKITKFCERAKNELKCDWAWVDTCCIDKSSSAELSEAINSMFTWYGNANYCVVYLQDVTTINDHQAFRESKWFERGWTLQELLAPRHVVFWTMSWERMGSKDDPRLSGIISSTTGIPQRVLTDPKIIHNISVARRMSWVAGRVTSRSEDLAYCLLGIFDINMPLLYGEGTKAFHRLQTHILEHYDDDSLFAWQQQNLVSQVVPHGILAKHPDAFANCGNIVSVLTPQRLDHAPIRMTSRGVEIDSLLYHTHMTSPSGQSIFIYPLNCGFTSGPSEFLDMRVTADTLLQGRVNTCYIALSRTSAEESFTRINAGMVLTQTNCPYQTVGFVPRSRFYVRTSYSIGAAFRNVFTPRATTAPEAKKHHRQRSRSDKPSSKSNISQQTMTPQVSIPSVELTVPATYAGLDPAQDPSWDIKINYPPQESATPASFANSMFNQFALPQPIYQSTNAYPMLDPMMMSQPQFGPGYGSGLNSTNLSQFNLQAPFQGQPFGLPKKGNLNRVSNDTV